jgi:hypothetical protein
MLSHIYSISLHCTIHVPTFPLNPSELPTNHQQVFNFYFKFSKIFIFSCILVFSSDSLPVHLIYGKFHSTYYHYTQHILVSFNIFWEKDKDDAKYWKNFAFYFYMHSYILHILSVRTVLLCIVSLYVKFHSAYYTVYVKINSGYYLRCKVFP